MHSGRVLDFYLDRFYFCLVTWCFLEQDAVTALPQSTFMNKEVLALSGTD